MVNEDCLEQAFTLSDFNDAPQPCFEQRCSGMVEPTVNANLGRCTGCAKVYNWEDYWQRREEFYPDQMI